MPTLPFGSSEACPAASSAALPAGAPDEQPSGTTAATKPTAQSTNLDIIPHGA